ncbi:MAG: carbohydrate-binding domain-containing protein [Paludibacteraceae bacterium]|nr:carbohydrate-binding domain-containing protein [Paludibacteraceae bacterium]
MRIYSLLSAVLLSGCLFAQTLNVKVGQVLYLFPASQAGSMTYSDGITLTVMNKTFTLSEVSDMYVDNTEVTDATVSVVYNNTTASITVAGNVARYLTITQSGAHVSIAQSSDLAQEITYTLSGNSSDGEFYMSGSYKATVELSGLTLTNATPVYSGAAVHIQNGKRIDVKVVTGTTNTLRDAATGSQKGALYIKGHAEFRQKGTLNIYGNLKHGIKTGEYMTVKNATINVLSSVGDGINCAQYFLMESGTLSLSGIGDDGVQCDIDDTTTGSTGQTTDHEDEDSGNVYISGGTMSITVTAAAAKGVKAEGDMYVTGGTITATTTGGGAWDSDELKTKASAGLSADGNMAISGGTLTLTSSGAGGKGISADGSLTISDSTAITITTKGQAVVASSSGSLTTVSNSSQLDRYSTNYKSSPKGIKVDGTINISGGKVSVTTSGAGGEGIESKSTMNITGGEVVVNSNDDGLNCSSHLTISGGMVYVHATNNDGIDSNGNCYIKGGLVYAISAGSPEVAIDANTEGGYKLYVQGGTIVAIGGLESGASLSQSCYSAGSSSSGGGRWGGGGSSGSWSTNTWYALTVGSNTFAFKTPSSGGSGMVVSGASTPTLKSSVTPSGTAIFGGVGYYPATISGGSAVTLSSYSGSQGGGRPGW